MGFGVGSGGSGEGSGVGAGGTGSGPGGRGSGTVRVMLRTYPPAAATVRTRPGAQTEPTSVVPNMSVRRLTS